MIYKIEGDKVVIYAGKEFYQKFLEGLDKETEKILNDKEYFTKNYVKSK